MKATRKARLGAIAAAVLLLCPFAFVCTKKGRDNPLDSHGQLISSNKASLQFQAFQRGALPFSQTFLLTNGGAGTLNWKISYDAAWLDVSPTSPSNSNTATITVTTNTTVLSPGTYTDTITITSFNADNSPQTVNVTYTISDDRGDINLDSVNNEYDDAVLFSDYFIYGLGVFHINVDGQIAATDVNADGMALTVGDLAYIIRIIAGDALPPPLPPETANYMVDQGVISVDASMGAACVAVQGNVTPELLAVEMDIKYDYNAEDTLTRVLVYSLKGNGFEGEFLNANGEVVSIEMGSYEGAVVKLNNTPP